jgi:DNA-binding MarR family transcriptional regulator
LLTVCFTLKDIAEYIGVHYTVVSRVVKKIERGKMKCDIARPELPI